MNPFAPCLFVLSGDVTSETRGCAQRIAEALRESGSAELFGLLPDAAESEPIPPVTLPALRLSLPASIPAGLAPQLTAATLHALRPRAVVGDRTGIATIALLLPGAPSLKTAVLITPDDGLRSDRKLLRPFAHSRVIPESLSAGEIAERLG